MTGINKSLKEILGLGNLFTTPMLIKRYLQVGKQHFLADTVVN